MRNNKDTTVTEAYPKGSFPDNFMHGNVPYIVCPGKEETEIHSGTIGIKPGSVASDCAGRLVVEPAAIAFAPMANGDTLAIIADRGPFKNQKIVIPGMDEKMLREALDEVDRITMKLFLSSDMGYTAMPQTPLPKEYEQYDRRSLYPSVDLLRHHTTATHGNE